MPDIEDTIRRLEKIAGHAVHYAGEPPFIMSLDDGNAIHEAIDLMKKQIPIEPELNEKHMYVSDAFKCGKCGAFVQFHCKYCQMCGQVVKWE